MTVTVKMKMEIQLFAGITTTRLVILRRKGSFVPYARDGNINNVEKWMMRKIIFGVIYAIYDISIPVIPLCVQETHFHWF